MRKLLVFFVFILAASTTFAGTLNVDGVGGTPGNYATLSAALAIANATTEDCTITFSTVGPIYEAGVLGNINPNTLQHLIVDGNVGGQRAEIVTDATTAGDLARTYIDAGQTYTFKNLIFRPSWRGGAEAAHNGFELDDSAGAGDATTEFINCLFTGSTATGMADPFDTTLTDGEVTGFLGGTTTGIILSSSIGAGRDQIYNFENTILAWSGGGAIVCYGEFVTMNLGPGFVIANCQGSGDGIYASTTNDGYFNIHLRGEENNRNLIYRTSSSVELADPDVLLDMEYTDVIECADRLLNNGVSGEGGLVRAATHCIFYHGAAGALRYSAWNASATDITFDHCTVYDSDGNQLLWTGSAGGVYNDFWFTDTIMADPDIGGVGRDIRAGNDSHDGHWDYCALYNVYWYGDVCQTAGPRWWQTNMVGTPCSGDAPDPLFISTDVADYLPADLASWDTTKITLNDDYFMDVSNFDYHAAASDGGALSGAAQYYGPVNLIVDGVGGTPYHYALLSGALAAAVANPGDVTISFTTVGPINEPGVLGDINPNYPLYNLVVDGDVGGQRAEIVSDATTAGDLARTYIDTGQTYTFKNLIFRPSWRGGAEAAHNGFELDDSGGTGSATTEFVNCVFTGTTASGMADPFDTTLADTEVTGFLGGSSTGIIVSSSIDPARPQVYNFENTILSWCGGSAIVCYGEQVTMNLGPGFVITNCQGTGDGLYGSSTAQTGYFNIHLVGEANNRNLIYRTSSGIEVLDPDALTDMEYTDVIECADRLLNNGVSGEGGLVRAATHCIFYHGAAGALRYSAWNASATDITFDHCTVYDSDGNQLLWTGSAAGVYNDFWFTDTIMADPDIGGVGRDIRAGNDSHDGHWDYCALYNVYWYGDVCQTAGPRWWQTNMVGTPCSGDAPDPMFISTDIADYLPANLAAWDAQKITLSDDFFMDVSDWRYQGAGSGGSDLSGAADFLLPVNEWRHYLD